MIIGTITAPQGIITGAFTILFTFQRPIDFSMADVEVETIEGDALGYGKDTFRGEGANYHVLCYLPDMRAGKSRISVSKADVSVEPVVVEYDTVNRIIATWGQPTHRSRRIEIPVTLDTAVRILKKRHFRVLPSAQYQIYGEGKDYILAFAKAPEMITIQGAVMKANGINAVIHASKWEATR